MRQPVVEIQSLDVRRTLLEVMKRDSQPVGDGHLRYRFQSVWLVADGDCFQALEAYLLHFNEFIVIIPGHFMDPVKDIAQRGHIAHKILLLSK